LGQRTTGSGAIISAPALIVLGAPFSDSDLSPSIPIISPNPVDLTIPHQLSPPITYSNLSSRVCCSHLLPPLLGVSGLVRDRGLTPPANFGLALRANIPATVFLKML
jgi:hypothetical protein